MPTPIYFMKHIAFSNLCGNSRILVLFFVSLFPWFTFSVALSPTYLQNNAGRIKTQYFYLSNEFMWPVTCNLQVSETVSPACIFNIFLGILWRFSKISERGCGYPEIRCKCSKSYQTILERFWWNNWILRSTFIRGFYS